MECQIDLRLTCHECMDVILHVNIIGKSWDIEKQLNGRTRRLLAFLNPTSSWD